MKQGTHIIIHSAYVLGIYYDRQNVVLTCMVCWFKGLKRDGVCNCLW